MILNKNELVTCSSDEIMIMTSSSINYSPYKFAFRFVKPHQLPGASP